MTGYSSNAFRGTARLWPLLEPDVSVLGFPFPLLSAGLVYSVALGLFSTPVSSRCGSCYSWGTRSDS